MLDKKTIFVGIGFGTSVRDFLTNSSFLNLLKIPEYEFVVFLQDTNLKENLIFKNSKIQFKTLHPYNPTKFEKILLHFHRSVLRKKCKTIDLGNTSGDTSTLDKFTPFANFLIRIFGYGRVHNFISFLYSFVSQNTIYDIEFRKYNPKLLIVTRVLNYSLDYPLLKSANKYNVSTIALVSSWDNFTSKAFFPFKIKKIVVWNKIMRQEAIELYNFKSKDIFVSGIARYDTFFNEIGFDDKKTFFQKFSLDLNKKLITYATGSSTTGVTKLDQKSPEIGIVNFLSNQINFNPSFANFQLMVRLHPQANKEDYKFLSKYPKVKLFIPGKDSKFQDRLFNIQDDIELGETMKYSDVVINLASTITIDACVFDTPVICINFDFNGERPFSYSVKRFYKFDHYAKLLKHQGFTFASSKEEILDQILCEVKNPERLSENRKKIVLDQCEFTDGNSGNRVAEFLTNQIF